MSFDLWAFGFQAVNVLVLVWLLQRFFWKPVAAMITQRRKAAQTMLADATAQADKAKAELAQIQSSRAEMEEARTKLMAKAQDQAKAARDDILAAARAAADDLADTAKAARARDESAEQAKSAKATQDLALIIAGQLVARLDGPAAQDAFLGWLSDGLAALPSAERADLLKTTLEVVTAHSTNSAAQKRITSAVAAALGAPPDLTFRTEPALLAGLELHSAHFILRNSWRADLARIAAALNGKGDVPDAA